MIVFMRIKVIRFMLGIIYIKITNYFKPQNILLIIFTSFGLFFCNRNHVQKNQINWLASLNWAMAKRFLEKLALAGQGRKSFQVGLH